MKAQDIVILLKIITLGNKAWSMNDLSRSLFLSQSEVSKALERMSFSGLIDESKKVPAFNSLYDVVVNSVKFLFPVKPGCILRGIPTAHSAEPLCKKIRSESKYISPDALRVGWIREQKLAKEELKRGSDLFRSLRRLPP